MVLDRGFDIANKIKSYHIEVYKKYWRWRWRVTATNGRIIGASTQGYKRRVDCIDNIESLGQSLIDGIIFSKDKG